MPCQSEFTKHWHSNVYVATARIFIKNIRRGTLGIFIPNGIIKKIKKASPLVCGFFVRNHIDGHVKIIWMSDFPRLWSNYLLTVVKELKNKCDFFGNDVSNTYLCAMKVWFLTKKPHILGLSILPFFILILEWKTTKFLSEYFLQIFLRLPHTCL